MKIEDYIKKYSYVIEYSDEDEAYLAKCAEVADIITHGDSAEEALSEIRAAVQGALVWMQKDGKDLPEPFSLRKFSGNFRVRISPKKHRELAKEAHLNGISMNQLIANKL